MMKSNYSRLLRCYLVLCIVLYLKCNSPELTPKVTITERHMSIASITKLVLNRKPLIILFSKENIIIITPGLQFKLT